MAKTPKVAAPIIQTTEPGEIDLSKVRIRISGPAGGRRRAGLSFGQQPVVLTFADLGETIEDAQDRLKVLQADPQLSIAPVIEEGAVAPAKGDKTED